MVEGLACQVSSLRCNNLLAAVEWFACLARNGSRMEVPAERCGRIAAVARKSHEAHF